ERKRKNSDSCENMAGVEGDTCPGMMKRRCGGDGKYIKDPCVSKSSTSSPSSSSISSVDIGSILKLPVGIGASSIPYLVVKRKGAGISSVVFECRCQADTGMSEHEVVTVKVMSGGNLGLKTCLQEVETLSFLKLKREEAGLGHGEAHFVEMISWFYRHSALGSIDNVCLVFAGGGVSLLEIMREKSETEQSWGLRETLSVAKGLLGGISFVHSMGLIHADIKPENIAIYPKTSSTTQPNVPSLQTTQHSLASPMSNPPSSLVRLIDFGNAVFSSDAQPGVTAGTPSYLSPEARLGHAWGPGVDTWAVGCVLYELITGERFGSAQDGAKGVTWCRGGSVGLRMCSCGVDAWCRAHGLGNPGLMRLVGRLLQEDPRVRSSAKEALQDPCLL
ncbi:unnamed protein product, partial [Choristocarpus tenellus]